MRPDTIFVSTGSGDIGSVATLGAATIAGAVAFLAVFYQKRSERLAVNRAILAEISRLISVLQAHSTWWIQTQARDETDVPLIPFSADVYRSLIDNLGVLDSRFVADAVHFYGFIDFLNQFQASRAERVRRGVLREFDESYGEMLRSGHERFSRCFDKAFQRYQIPLPSSSRIVRNASEQHAK